MPCSHPQGNTVQSSQAFPRHEAVEGKAKRPRGLFYPSSSPSVLDEPLVGGKLGSRCSFPRGHEPRAPEQRTDLLWHL